MSTLCSSTGGRHERLPGRCYRIGRSAPFLKRRGGRPRAPTSRPWLFFYAVSDSDRARFAATLTERNREWAKSASVLIYVTARRMYARSGRENHHRRFDAGAAWVSLALQARRLGLYAHGMAGFDRAAAYEMLALPEDEYDLIAAVAVGRHGDAAGPAAAPFGTRVSKRPETAEGYHARGWFRPATRHVRGGMNG